MEKDGLVEEKSFHEVLVNFARLFFLPHEHNMTRTPVEGLFGLCRFSLTELLLTLVNLGL
jgi:hypothetical protein